MSDRADDQANPNLNAEANEPAWDRDDGMTRRDLLKTGAAAAILSAVNVAPGEAEAGGKEHEVFGEDRRDRRESAYELRCNAAESYLHFKDAGPRVQPVNGDEALYSDYRASFSKTLRHAEYGLVSRKSYRSFLHALYTGESEDFERILIARHKDPNRVRLVSPQAARAFEMFGRDGNDLRMPEAPTFASAETAAEMGELYWYALTRDVPFIEYESSLLVSDAANDLNAFSRSDIFPGENGSVTPATIFRGGLPGATTGPMVSQFLLQPVQFGRHLIDQRYDRPRAGGVNDFMTHFDEWRGIQRGKSPEVGTSFTGEARFFATMRDLSEFVHVDSPLQSGLYAALYLLGQGDDALDPNNPYLRSASRTQQGFASFGPADIQHLVSHGPRLALTGAWYQKWLAHRRLRPEAFAARINVELRGMTQWDIHPDIYDSEALARIVQANPTGDPANDGLLPMGYPEGSPAHPAYPGGHSAFVAAAATILKAWFNEDYVIPNPVHANADGTALVPWTGAPLTVGNELNKLVGNITHARDGAGMHYRSDGRGNYLGEQQALGVLADYSLTYKEEFDGFELTLFSGDRVTIRDGDVHGI